MISDAYVRVHCDVCGCEEEVELTALAGGGWDERDVQPKLERMGWLVDGDRHLCPDCREAEVG